MRDRRKFLLAVARGAVYTAPLIRTLVAPASLHALQASGEMGMGMLVVTPTSKAPWSAPPPASTPEGSKVPGST